MTITAIHNGRILQATPEDGRTPQINQQVHLTIEGEKKLYHVSRIEQGEGDTLVYIIKETIYG